MCPRVSPSGSKVGGNGSSSCEISPRPIDEHGSPLLFEGLGLLAPTADMHGESEGSSDRANFVVVVTLVQTHALRLAWRRPWSGNGDALDGFSEQFEVVPIWVQIDQAAEILGNSRVSVRQKGDQQGIYELLKRIGPWRSPDADPSTYDRG
jgi:hypothetical protein